MMIDYKELYEQTQCELDAVMQLGIDKWLTEEYIKSEPNKAQRAATAREKVLRMIENLEYLTLK